MGGGEWDESWCMGVEVSGVRVSAWDGCVGEWDESECIGV